MRDLLATSLSHPFPPHTSITHSHILTLAGYFLTRIFHPNIATNGDICVNTLKKDWKPEHTLTHVLQVIRCLLIVPFPESSLNDDAGKLFMESYDEYARKAKLMTSIHAMGSGSSSSTSSSSSSGAGAGAGAGACSSEGAGDVPLAAARTSNTGAAADTSAPAKKAAASSSSSSAGAEGNKEADKKKKNLKRL